MKLEEQVCSLELAKRLKELGVRQESLFDWNWSGLEGEMVELVYWPDHRTHELKFLYAAFTDAELGEMLPAYLIDDSGEGQMRFDLNIWKDAGWHIAYWWDEDTRRLSDLKIEVFVEATEANARAKMLVYLLENSLITL